MATPADIIIYDHPLSPYGQKVKIALLEKGLGFDARLPTGIGSGVTGDEFASASPRGEVPAFVMGEDVRIFDSSIILAYIEDRWPNPSLLPEAPIERARVRMLEEAMDTHFEAITWGLSEIRYFGRATGELAVALEASAAAQIEGWYAWLTAQLGDRQWFNGAGFGWADLAIVPFVNAAAGFGVEPEGVLASWLVRANERESVKQVTAAAKAVAFDGPNTNLEQLKAAVETGMFKREYRDHRLEWMIRSGGIAVVENGLAKNNIRFTEVFPAVVHGRADHP